MSERVLIIGKGFLGRHLEKKLKELNNDVFTTGLTQMIMLILDWKYVMKNL